MNWISKNRITKRQDLVDALDEATAITVAKNKKGCDYGMPVLCIYPEMVELLFEQIGKLRSMVDHLPEDK